MPPVGTDVNANGSTTVSFTVTESVEDPDDAVTVTEYSPETVGLYETVCPETVAPVTPETESEAEDGDTVNAWVHVSPNII